MATSVDPTQNGTSLPTGAPAVAGTPRPPTTVGPGAITQATTPPPGKTPSGPAGETFTPSTVDPHTAQMNRLQTLARGGATTAVQGPQLSPQVATQDRQVMFDSFKTAVGAVHGQPIPQLPYAEARDRLNGQVGYFLADHTNEQGLSPQEKQLLPTLQPAMQQSMKGYLAQARTAVAGMSPQDQETHFAGALSKAIMQDVNPTTSQPRWPGLWVNAYQYLHSGQ